VKVDEDIIDRRLSSIAAVISDGLAQISREMTEQLLTEIPELRGDEMVERLLYVSVEENVIAMLHALELHAVPTAVAAPSGAAEYARRLAQRGVSAIALVRAYRIGHAAFLEWSLREISRLNDDLELVEAITHRVLQLSFAYIDRVSEEVVGAHQQERDRWIRTQTAVRASRVAKLLAEEDIDTDTTEAALGYRLRQQHLAVIGWIPDAPRTGDGLVHLERLGQALATGLGSAGRPLFVPYDDAVAWLWLPFSTRRNVDWAKLHEIVMSADPELRVSVGELEKGVEGFRASHHQAVGAYNVALAAQPPRRVTTARRVGPVALMCGDLRGTRVWVQKTLGTLAVDEKNNSVLRETLRVFLESGGSFATAAETLNLHRNTVQYRLQKAKELLPVPIAENRADLELALRACDQLGSALLRNGR